MKRHVPLLVLVAFSFFGFGSAYRVGLEGFGVFLREPWAVLVAVDLYIALFFVGAWMLRDARSRGVSAAPFVVLLPFVGTIGALLYVVRCTYGSMPRRSDA